MIKKIVNVNNYLLIFLILELLFPGCTNKETITENMNLSVVVKNFKSWVNLMPGFSKEHSIHISGKFIINNIAKTDKKQFKLKAIKILQGDNERYFDSYSLIPLDTIDFVPGSKKEFSVSGVTVVDEKTKINYNVVAEFVFFYSSLNRNYIDTVSNILIAKVY